jgi:Zn-dependent peptidase ImmA (M78 family)
MKRGFKTWAEKAARDVRLSCGCAPFAPLPARVLAAQLRIPVITPDQIPGLPSETLHDMIVRYTKNWSAVTLMIEGKPLIVHNPSHIPPRQESNLMHEMAHIICKHSPAQVRPPGDLPWASRTYNVEQEAEAEWLGGCLQVPREALLRMLRRGYSLVAIAEHFGASEEMVRYRQNATGVQFQVSRGRKFRRVSSAAGELQN